MISSKRNIRSGSNYNQYFDLGKVQGNEVSLLSNGSVDETVQQMKKIVRNTLPQTKRIATALEGSTKLETARNIWNFIYNHIQYKQDNPLREQLRQPLRTWKDRTTGVDCDCYSILISSMLTNLGIAHSFRIAAYKADYQHVYVVVPDGSKNIIIDCVADRFNYEVTPTKTKDFTVMNGSSLNGFGNTCRSAQPAVVYMSRERIEKRGYVFTTDVLSKHGIAFTETINDNGNVPEVHAIINGKNVVLPTAMKREQAKALVNQPAEKSIAQSTNGLSGITTNKVLTGLGIGALLYFFFSGDESKPGTAGLGKTKTPAKKVAVIQI